MVKSTPVYYEQPLQELVRLFLRLEFLFTIISQSMSGKRVVDSHTALIAMVNTPSALDHHSQEVRERLFFEAMMRIVDRELPGYAD